MTGTAEAERGIHAMLDAVAVTLAHDPLDDRALVRVAMAGGRRRRLRRRAGALLVTAAAVASVAGVVHLSGRVGDRTGVVVAASPLPTLPSDTRLGCGRSTSLAVSVGSSSAPVDPAEQALRWASGSGLLGRYPGSTAAELVGQPAGTRVIALVHDRVPVALLRFVRATGETGWHLTRADYC